MRYKGQYQQPITYGEQYCDTKADVVGYNAYPGRRYSSVTMSYQKMTLVEPASNVILRARLHPDTRTMGRCTQSHCAHIV